MMKEKEQKILEFDWDNRVYTAPGLIDLQVNGVIGIDFNDISLEKKEVLEATKYLLSRGVTAYYPTVITNSSQHIVRLFEVLTEACHSYPLVNKAITGFHLEGPFISSKDGARGAHDARFIQPPDWELFQKFQGAAGGRIKLVTIAPEWEGSGDFIEKCRREDILVSMGHSMATTQQIADAINAGITLSTHLGNGVPPMLKRHPNIVWDQLADDQLTAMVIADGHHLSDTFLKVVKRVKRRKMLLVSDSTLFVGMPPGEYTTFIGGKVTLSKDRKLALDDGSGLLAGAAKDLIECIETLVSHGLTSIDEAWQMASTNIIHFVQKNTPDIFEGQGDKVIFQREGDKIQVLKTFINGELVYQRERL